MELRAFVSPTTKLSSANKFAKPTLTVPQGIAIGQRSRRGPIARSRRRRSVVKDVCPDFPHPRCRSGEPITHNAMAANRAIVPVHGPRVTLVQSRKGASASEPIQPPDGQRQPRRLRRRVGPTRARSQNVTAPGSVCSAIPHARRFPLRSSLCFLFDAKSLPFVGGQLTGFALDGDWRQLEASEGISRGAGGWIADSTLSTKSSPYRDGACDASANVAVHDKAPDDRDRRRELRMFGARALSALLSLRLGLVGRRARNLARARDSLWDWVE